ncbi:MAG: hypothetical protein ACYDCQ_13810 [Dehalococcoidia bacterium]
MARSSVIARLLATSLALVLLAACSSGNNKNTKNNTGATASPSGTIAPTVAAASTRAGASPTAPAISIGAATAAPVGTAPASASPLPAASLTPVAVDSALQQALEGAILQQSDLPAGFSPTSQPPSRQLTTPGAVAQYAVLYINNLTGGTVVFVDSIFGFKDAPAAAAAFKDAPRLLQDTPTGSIKLEPAAGGPSLGDESASYKVTVANAAFTYQGYAILWHRGRVGGTMLVYGQPAPQSVDELAALATKQDNALKAVPQ